MIHSIDTNHFAHQNQVNFCGEIHHSKHNHKYYTSQDGLIILEESNDDNSFYYWLVDPTNGETEYIGSVMSTFSMFNENYNGYPERNENGIIELDTNFC